MSQMRFLYENLFDLATLSPSSEQNLNPAENTQNQILGKTWRTFEGYTIRTDINDKLGFKATATGSVVLATVASSTGYTGSALASVIQTAMRSGTVFDITCIFDDSDNKFRFATGATATALSLHNTYATSSVMTIIGYDRNTNYTGEVGYTGTASLGNESWLQATLGAGTSTHFVIDKFNMLSGTVLTLRLADATSTFDGLYGGSMSASVSITLTGTRSVNALPASFSGLGLQLHWHDPSQSFSEVGRIWIGGSFYPANHPDNDISWFKRLIRRRSGKTTMVSGATRFDRRDPINEYTIIPDPLSKYYNPATKTGWETMLDYIADYNSMYVILDSDLSNTVYGFVPGNTAYNRTKNTVMFKIPPIKLQEQK